MSAKSVSTSTCVFPSASLIELEIVAFADPWPRLSRPLALIVTLWWISSTSVSCNLPAYAAVVGPSLIVKLPS